MLRLLQMSCDEEVDEMVQVRGWDAGCVGGTS